MNKQIHEAFKLVIVLVFLSFFGVNAFAFLVDDIAIMTAERELKKGGVTKKAEDDSLRISTIKKYRYEKSLIGILKKRCCKNSKMACFWFNIFKWTRNVDYNYLALLGSLFFGGFGACIRNLTSFSPKIKGYLMLKNEIPIITRDKLEAALSEAGVSEQEKDKVHSVVASEKITPTEIDIPTYIEILVSVFLGVSIGLFVFASVAVLPSLLTSGNSQDVNLRFVALFSLFAGFTYPTFYRILYTRFVSSLKPVKS